jgi:SAM-dependent methyltransferase
MKRQLSCSVCGHAEGHRAYRVPETMFRSGEVFTYLECPACGCLRLADDAAPDGRDAYPPDYYAHRRRPVPPSDLPARIRRRVRRWRNRLLLRDDGLGRAVDACHLVLPHPALRALSRLGLRHDASILDVGCGGGELVADLADLGFERCLGIDPWLDDEAVRGSDGLLKRMTFDDVQGEWDAILFDHALEHIDDPAGAFAHVARCLAPGGTCLVRMPVVPCAAWRAYRECWVQIDAPRHRVVYSARGLDSLGERAGLRCVRVVHDSTALQFWGSERCRRGLPVHDGRPSSVSKWPAGFSVWELLRYGREARRLNRCGDGDQAAFYFVRA